eukprot:scpid77840/ scgid3388/ 
MLSSRSPPGCLARGLLSCALILVLFPRGVFVYYRGGSCMMRLFERAGFSADAASQYERRARKMELWLETLKGLDTHLMGLFLGAPPRHVKMFQDCFARRTLDCQYYSPCKNGGLCWLSTRPWDNERVYRCHCPPETLYEGDFCERLVGATMPQYGALKADLEYLNDTVLEKAKYQSIGCQHRVQGFKYTSRHNRNDGRDTGEIMSLIFNKKYQSTILKVVFSANTRSATAGGFVRWFVTIDGEECAWPAKLDMVRYQSKKINFLLPSVLIGYCQSMTTYSGIILPGNHTIAVNVGPVLKRKQSNAYTGRLSTTLLEVYEVCAPHQYFYPWKHIDYEGDPFP